MDLDVIIKSMLDNKLISEQFCKWTNGDYGIVLETFSLIMDGTFKGKLHSEILGDLIKICASLIQNNMINARLMKALLDIRADDDYQNTCDSEEDENFDENGDECFDDTSVVIICYKKYDQQLPGRVQNMIEKTVSDEFRDIQIISKPITRRKLRILRETGCINTLPTIIDWYFLECFIRADQITRSLINNWTERQSCPTFVFFVVGKKQDRVLIYIKEQSVFQSIINAGYRINFGQNKVIKFTERPRVKQCKNCLIAFDGPHSCG